MTDKRSVPFFNYPHVFTENENDILKLIVDVGRRGAFIMQKDLSGFEKDLASYTGARFAVGVANATDGLQMGLMAAGISRGDEVIFCSHTMVATASAIFYTGATPIPVEAGYDHLIDVESIGKAITPKTKAIVPTQLNGRTADMDAIRKIADRHNLMILEDAAQGLGSKFKGRCAGTFGEAACISFYPAKNLGCFGDGGAVLTNSEEIYKKLILLRDHGRDNDGEVVLWGFNSRLDNLQAAILHYRFKKYDDIVNRRRTVAGLYRERLKDLDELNLPPGPDNDPDHFDVFQNYEIQADDRDRLKIHLSEKGIGTLLQWGGRPVHQFKKLGFHQSLPKTDRLFQRILMLPMNMSVTDEDVEYISDCIKAFYR
jgi:dTDP-4-amino-4,6-dideoxygalactose transaminase